MVPILMGQTRYWINRVIIPCKVGTLKPVVVDEATIVIVFRVSAWAFYYHFEGDKRSGRFFGMRIPKEYKSPRIPKKLFDKQKFIAEPKMAFVVSENLDDNCPYIEGLVQKYRMTPVPVLKENE